MERIINAEILIYLLKHNLIGQHQHGFIKWQSTCTNLIECLSDWSLNMQSKCFTDVLYFDFKKAFGSVSHDKLLLKVVSYGISGDLYQWIATFLRNRTQAVQVDNILSSFINVTSGVPQGSVLGPTLFLFLWCVHIFGDLNVMCKLYADDQKLYTTYNLSTSHTDLSAATHWLVSWADEWQLKIAAQKCTVCRLQNPKWHKPQNYTFQVYKIDDYTLPLWDTVHDLGVRVESNFKFDKHISAITKPMLELT